MKIVSLLMTDRRAFVARFSHLWLCAISNVWSALLRSITEFLPPRDSRLMFSSGKSVSVRRSINLGCGRDTPSWSQPPGAPWTRFWSRVTSKPSLSCNRGRGKKKKTCERGKDFCCTRVTPERDTICPAEFRVRVDLQNRWRPGNWIVSESHRVNIWQVLIELSTSKEWKMIFRNRKEHKILIT